MSLRRLVPFILTAALGFALVPGTALAQRATIVQSIDEPARSPYQQFIIFNQGPSTCTAFTCAVTFPAVPAGKRLEITYASGLFGVSPAGAGGANISVRSSDSIIGIYLPLPQSYNGGLTYVGGGPVTLYVEAGATPIVNLSGGNVNASTTSAQAAIVGHLVTVP